MPTRPPVQFDKVRKQIKKAELEKLVKNLVRIQSHPEVPTQEKEVAQFINEFLTDDGVDCKLRPVERDRPNVISIIKGSASGKSLMLSGHTDTVPAFEMDVPPFAPKVAKGRLYGRGALDMKGGLGAMMIAMVAVDRARVRLAGDLMFTGVVGEERRSEGTEDIVLKGPRADMCIIGEPTSLEVQPTHRGLEWLEVHVYGKAAHGGQADKGVNAISMAARFVKAVEEDLLPKLRERKSKYMIPPTLNLGVIQGGQQPSSVADHCVIKIDRRWIPEESLQQVFKEFYAIFDRLKKDDQRFKAVLKRDPSNMLTMTHVPNVVSTSHPVVRALGNAAREVSGKAPKITTFWGWSDAALFTHFAKMPTVIYGPGGAGAHARVEYVNVDDLVKCAQVYAHAALEICGAGS